MAELSVHSGVCLCFVQTLFIDEDLPVSVWALGSDSVHIVN